MNLGESLPAEPPEGLLTTVAWTLGETAGPCYALEGAVFSTGSAIQWLRDGLGIISEAAECGPLAESVTDTEGVHIVPAFTGLGSPWWDPHARGALVGLTRSTGKAQLARAVVESMAFQVADVVQAMEAASGVAVAELRVDGGASVMDVLCQFQADVLRAPLRRSAVAETTALGAAYLAGLAEGVWASPDEVAAHWRADGEWAPVMGEKDAARRRREWLRAVEVTRAYPALEI
jgi:glycerol kinase